MADEKTSETYEAKTEELTIEIPDILGLVERFSYVNHTRVASTAADVRIAVTDLNPLAPAKQRIGQPIGIVMSHRHARNLSRALKSVVDRLDQAEAESKETQITLKRPD